MKPDSNTLSAILVRENQFIGYIIVRRIKVYEESQPIFSDTCLLNPENLLDTSKNKFKGYAWVINHESEFDSRNSTRYNYFKSIYNVLKQHQPKHCFMLPYYAWELWFIEDNKLKAFSIFRNSIVGEKELIDGILNEEINGRMFHFIKYKP